MANTGNCKILGALRSWLLISMRSGIKVGSRQEEVQGTSYGEQTGVSIVSSVCTTEGDLCTKTNVQGG